MINIDAYMIYMYMLYNKKFPLCLLFSPYPKKVANFY